LLSQLIPNKLEQAALVKLCLQNILAGGNIRLTLQTLAISID
jgi:hypothetical protein